MTKAVLLIGFGGPEKPEEVRPFLENVLRGIKIPQERFEEVLHHYEEVGGRSPYNAEIRKLCAALEPELEKRGVKVPVREAFRHSQPSFEEVLNRLKEEKVERAAGIVLSALNSFPSYGRYVDRLEDAKKKTESALEIRYAPAFADHPLFLEAQTARVREKTGGAHAGKNFFLFSAHSIPQIWSDQSGYARQFEELCARVAAGAGLEHWGIGYQSRSGGPDDAWLGPDVREKVRQVSSREFENVVAVPAGFVCENVEILYDLDIELKSVAKTAGLGYSRASTVAGHPKFLELAARLASEALEAA